PGQRLRSRPLPRAGQERARDALVAAADPAPDRRRPGPPRGVLTRLGARRLAGRPRHRGRVHLEGGGPGHRRHVLPPPRALGADRLRRDRPAAGGPGPDARLLARRDLLPGDTAPGLARRAGRRRARLRPRSRRVRGHGDGGRQHPRPDPDPRPRHLSRQPGRPGRPGGRAGGRDRRPGLRRPVDDRVAVPAAGTEGGGVIELSFELPLATAELRVEAELPAAVTAVMGPSGAGKTSLLEAIAGLRRKARGRIACHDVVFLDSARHLRLAPERRRVGYVPQDAGLFPHLTALGNVRFGARAGTRQAETAIETLEIGPLLARYPASLSGGEKQRVALARALATAPRMLLLDEPLAALDVELKERVLPYLMRIRDEWKVPILYVTHNVGEALALAGHVLFLRAGRVEAQGAP